MMSFRKQLAILVGITSFFVGPYLLLHGTNIVTHTYQFGAERLLNIQTPYVDPQGISDWFKYSPFFGILYYPIAWLSPRPEAFLWGLINILVFWAGMSRWASLGKESPRWIWAAFLFASMELDGSLRYQQMNALLTGMVLLGTAAYRDKKFIQAAMWLVFGSSFKLLPLAVLAPLALTGPTIFILSAFGWGLVTLLVPILVLGWKHTLVFHQDWFRLLLHDSQTSGILDLFTVLGRYGFHLPKLLVVGSIGVITLTGLFLARKKANAGLGSLISIALLGILLVNPRTESPTFVLAAPAYLFLAMEMGYLSTEKQWKGFVALGLAIFLITFCMNDLWPRAIWDATSMKQANKTFGVLVLWLLSWTMIWTRRPVSELTFGISAPPNKSWS